MHLAAGMGIFWHYRTDLQYESLVRIASVTGGHITVAHTGHGTIVGFIALLPPEDMSRWSGVEGVWELEGIEVARAWRGRGIAQRMVAALFASDVWEDRIVMAMAYRWCWDTEGMGLGINDYLNILDRLFGPFGFQLFHTDEPNIAFYPGNILGARIGKRVRPELLQAFTSRLWLHKGAEKARP